MIKLRLPKFLEGMASILNLFPRQKRLSYKDMFGTDEEMIASDWKAVGEDLRDAMEQFKKETAK